MATLVLTMPPSPGLPLSYEHRTLRAHEAYKAAGPSLALNNTSWLRGQSIMRGTLTSPRGTFDVAAKLGTTSSSIDALRKELTFYQRLRHLQGDCIPKCFGYFFTPSEDQTFGCLILEYCGKPLRSIYEGQSDIPFSLRVNIINVMKRIHDAGVVHGGFGVFDVLIANAKPFIVNFKNASVKVCERRMDIVKGTIAPKREQFGCPELYRLCVDLQIWKPRTFTFESQRFPVEDVSSPAALMKKISDDSESIEKSRADAVHATVQHLLDFYQEEFPGLEGFLSRRSVPIMYPASLADQNFSCVDWHRQWLAAGSPLPVQKDANESSDGDVAAGLWNLKIPIRSPTTGLTSF